MGDRYQTQRQIEALVSGFENCTTAADKFKHREHLIVGVCYLRSTTLEEALRKMRNGLFRFLDHNGVDRGKYDERLTRSWLALIQSVLEEIDPDLPLVETANRVLARLGESRLSV